MSSVARISPTLVSHPLAQDSSPWRQQAPLSRAFDRRGTFGRVSSHPVHRVAEKRRILPHPLENEALVTEKLISLKKTP
jgi:hypothetical protein